MENISNVVVVGTGSNPSKLHTQLDPVRLTSDMGMTVTSICHGEAFNITKDNNSFRLWLTLVDGIMISTDGIMTFKDEDARSIAVPEGRYNTTEELIEVVFTQMEATVRNITKDTHRYNVTKSVKKASDRIIITTNHVYIEATGESNKLWHLLGVDKDIKSNSEIEISRRDLKFGINPAFLYVNIVESSYINGKLSRNLALLPISLTPGCSYYEFNNPVYIPISVQDFSHILLEIRDRHGEYIKFVPGCAVIISLNLKPIKGRK